MAAGHIVSHHAPTAKVSADMSRKHRKWPLGTQVLVKTPAGYLLGKVCKHWRIDEVEHGASVEFPDVVDMGDANGSRFSHVIPFRSMKPVSKPDPYGRTGDGKVIQAPAGWRILREFEPVPAVHRECLKNGSWCAPRRGHSTMTPMVAGIWGDVRAFAVPRQ
ncbi:hypothetical protein [Burkholderia ubonensis]|nr:hypothetical protein [Burkholderia ubonensis]